MAGGVNQNRAMAGVIVALSAGLISGAAVWMSSWARACTPEEVLVMIEKEIGAVLSLRQEDLTRRAEDAAALASWQSEQRDSFDDLTKAVNAIENQQVRTNVILEQIQHSLNEGRRQ